MIFSMLSSDKILTLGSQKPSDHLWAQWSVLQNVNIKPLHLETRRARRQVIIFKIRNVSYFITHVLLVL